MEPKQNDAMFKLQMEMEIDQMKKRAPLFAQFIVEAAKQGFTYYNALVYAGFTERQAIDIIKSHGVSPKSGG